MNERSDDEEKMTLFVFMSAPCLLAFGKEEAQASEFKIAIYAVPEYLDVCYSKKKGEGKIS